MVLSAGQLKIKRIEAADPKRPVRSVAVCHRKGCGQNSNWDGIKIEEARLYFLRELFIAVTVVVAWAP